MRAAIVVPTIREESIRRFLEAWGAEFEGHVLIVVEDNPEPSFDLGAFNVRHVTWTDIDRELGEVAWIIPRRTDCVRSYGFLLASRESVDMIVTLDDDCYPHGPAFLSTHWEKLSSPASAVAWTSTGAGVVPRGVPYHSTARSLPTAISHGLWTNVPDFDALTQLVMERAGGHFEPLEQVIPLGSYFPMCGMNLAFAAEMIPAMYFLLMGQREWPYDRFGDIWCGVLAKKICDHLGFGVKSGAPFVEHQRASSVWMNLRKEAPGYEVNEYFWQSVDSVDLTADTVRDCYVQLSRDLPLSGDYWVRLRKAMAVWAELL